MIFVISKAKLIIFGFVYNGHLKKFLTQRRRERRVVVRGLCVMLSGEDWGEGAEGTFALWARLRFTIIQHKSTLPLRLRASAPLRDELRVKWHIPLWSFLETGKLSKK